MKKIDKYNVLNELKKQAFNEFAAKSDLLKGVVKIGAVVDGVKAHFVNMDVESIDECVKAMVAANDVKINPANNKPYFNLYIGRSYIDPDAAFSRYSDSVYFEVDNWLNE